VALGQFLLNSPKSFCACRSLIIYGTSGVAPLTGGCGCDVCQLFKFANYGRLVLVVRVKGTKWTSGQSYSVPQFPWVVEVQPHFTGVFFASATSDDVQGLAMLACEGIGAALSITAETPTKVGKLCTRDHQVS